MKQSKKYRSLVLWIFLAAIVAYFAYNIVSSLYNPLETTTVLEYEAGEGYSSAGYLVRAESLLYSDSSITVLSAADGAHVAAGEQIATGYQSDSAKTRQEQIDQLQTQIEQLQSAYQLAESASDKVTLDTAAKSDLATLAQYLNKRDMNSASDIATEIKGLILQQDSGASTAEELQLQITTLQTQENVLAVQASDDQTAIFAERSGCFCSAVDGYENILTPEILETMTAQDFSALSPEAVPSTVIGKLITDDTWYYVTSVPSNELENVKKGDTVTVSFARDFYKDITMKVVRVGNNEAGSKLLILSCSNYLSDTVMLREQSADIVFSAYSGLRVPKDAIHVEDGVVGVYVLEGAAAKWKPVNILHDNGESYVVEMDKTSTDNLWPGDEIIVNAKNLYNGKVVSGT